MATTTTVAAGVPYGVITLDGIEYIERPQVFAMELTVTERYALFTNQRLTMPGVANFLLKGLTRDTTSPSLAGSFLTGSVDRRFRFKLTNAEGSVWFFSGGLGAFDDRVVDACCFGSGQFPYLLIPPIPVSASGTLIYEVEDVGWFAPFLPAPPADYYPYTIHFGFQGSYLIPAAQANDTQSVVYSVAPKKG